MSKKSIIIVSLVAFTMSLILGVTISFAIDRGPEEIKLNTEGKRPAILSHYKHQERMKCEYCHHNVDKDDVVYDCGDGTDETCIQKCNSCHNPSWMSDWYKSTDTGNDLKKKEDLDNWKEIGHELCKNCHTANGITSRCRGCHPK